MHAQQLYDLISSQINDAEREYGEDGHVTIKIVRAAASHPKTPAEAPMYGAIVGCCGRAPAVNYFRDGQRCCPNGQVRINPLIKYLKSPHRLSTSARHVIQNYFYELMKVTCK